MVAIEAKPDSLILFRFRLMPPQACLNLNFDRLAVGSAGIVCTRDVLGIQLMVPDGKFDGSLLLAKRLGFTLLDVHSYCSFPNLQPIDLMAESWFEVVGSGPRDTVFGYADSSLDFVPLRSDHPDNLPFRQAVEILPLLDGEPSLGAAFADFRVARRQTGSYVGFYAFRVLEDVAYTFSKGATKADWGTMNARLGTNEGHWAALTKAGTAARHRPPEVIVPDIRHELLGLAKESLDRKLAVLRHPTA